MMKSRLPFQAMIAAAALAVCAGAMDARAQGAEPKLLGQYGVWGAYSAVSGGKKVCFALAKPASSKTNPPNRPRDPGYLFISTRPAEKVVNEISVNFGYPLKSDSAQLKVGNASFAMYTQSDTAWIKNAAEESALLDALRRGADAVALGVSGRGTQTTDEYSLKGVSQALDRVAQECR